MDFLSPVAARARRVSADRVRMQLTAAELASASAERMAEDMFCMTPTSGSEYEDSGTYMRDGFPRASTQAGRAGSPSATQHLARGEALGSPPPPRARPPPITPALPTFTKEAVPMLTPVTTRSLLSDTLQPLDFSAGMRRNARSFDVNEGGSASVPHARSKARQPVTTGSVVHRTDESSGRERRRRASPQGDTQPRHTRHRRSVSVESADAIAAAAAVAASSEFRHGRRRRGSASHHLTSDSHESAASDSDHTDSRSSAQDEQTRGSTSDGRVHVSAPASPLETVAEEIGVQHSTHVSGVRGSPPTRSRHTPAGYVSESSGLESDVMDEGRIWQVTQMLAGATIGDVIRGVVRLCNMRGGAFALLAPYTPGAMPHTGPPVSSDTDGVSHVRQQSSTLLPLAPGRNAPIAQGVQPGTVVVPRGVDEDMLGVDVIQAAAALAPTTPAKPLPGVSKPDMFVTRDGPLTGKDGAALRSPDRPPIASYQASTNAWRSPDEPSTAANQPMPSMFGLRVLEDGEADFDFPELDRSSRIESLGETNFALCHTRLQRHVLDIRIESAKSTRGAAILRISFRRPRQRRSRTESGGHKATVAQTSASALAVSTDPVDVHRQESDPFDLDDGAPVRGQSLSARSRTRRDKQQARHARSTRHLRGGDTSSEEEEGQDISFEEWYRREYGGTEASASVQNGDTVTPAAADGAPAGTVAAAEAAETGTAAGTTLSPDATTAGTATAPATVPASEPKADSSLLSFSFGWFSGSRARISKQGSGRNLTSASPANSTKPRRSGASHSRSSVDGDEYEGDVDEGSRTTASKPVPPRAPGTDDAASSSWLRTPRAFFGGAFRRFGGSPQVVENTPATPGAAAPTAAPSLPETAAPPAAPPTAAATPRRSLFSSFLSAKPSTHPPPALLHVRVVEGETAKPPLEPVPERVDGDELPGDGSVETSPPVASPGLVTEDVKAPAGAPAPPVSSLLGFFSRRSTLAEAASDKPAVAVTPAAEETTPAAASPSSIGSSETDVGST